MALYIKPPKGNINLVKLCTFIKRRLLFLYFIRGKSIEEIKFVIDKEKYLDDFDCLVEGSMKDRISHFVLRFLCSTDFEMRKFFIQSETELFQYRLEFYSEEDLNNLMFKACKQCKEVLQYPGLVKSYRNVLETFTYLVTDFEAEIQKRNSFLKVPFIYALDLVKRRLHHLTSGLVLVPLSELKLILISFFEEFVSRGILQTKSSQSIEQLRDPRFSYMVKEVKTWFKSNVSDFTPVPGIVKIITERQLDAESLKFPLCMKNIHLLLRKVHRLPHDARIQYILFLKEIGVPYQEVLNLFAKEYSFPDSSSSSCCHSWNDSKNRYVYSIQHLFGMKGSQKNYQAHSCYSLQCFESRSMYQGGCPFSCFDQKNISKSLLTENMQVSDVEDIMLFSVNKKNTEACSYFLSKRLQYLKHESSIIENNTVNNNQSIDDNVLGPKKIFTSLHSRCLSPISRPSEFYFILSNLMN